MVSESTVPKFVISRDSIFWSSVSEHGAVVALITWQMHQCMSALPYERAHVKPHEWNVSWNVLSLGHSPQKPFTAV